MIASARLLLCAAALSFLAGCATRQDVLLAKSSPASIKSVAQVPEEGNSPEMNAHLSNSLVSQGLQVKTALASGTRKTADVDAFVSYVDVWRWDLAMYMQSLSVKMFDAKTGDLLVTGQWRDSALHGFRDAKQVMNDLVAEMLFKLRSAEQK